jgi:competence protein ComGG
LPRRERMKNEGGFTYPVSLCLLVFFSLLLLITVDQNLAEKRFYKDTEVILIQEYYLLSAVKKAETLLKENNLPETGTFLYTKGTVGYQTRVLPEGLAEITFTVKLFTKEQWVGVGHFDTVRKKLVKWMEKS